MTLLPVERRTKKAVAIPAMPAPTTTTSTVRSERSGRGGSSGPSWASHGDRFGQSAYLDAGDPGAAFHRTSVISRARTHHEVDRRQPYRSGRSGQPKDGGRSREGNRCSEWESRVENKFCENAR